MVSTDKFNLLHSYIFRKKNVTMDNTFSYKDRSILYICQNGTSGYANAAKGYIYDYIGKNIPIRTQYFNCSDEVNENDRFHQYLNLCTSNDIKYNTIIVHSTPDIWTDVIKNAPNINLENKTIIGRTVWEFEKLLPEWVSNINTSIVDIVSVPTEWNKQCFINSGVIKPIIVEPHVYVDYPYKKVGLTVLSKKSILISKKEDISNINYNEYYKFYCIGQFIERKGIAETIDAFCNTFTSKDKVLLFIKTFKLNYSKEEQNKCLLEIVKIAEKYDHAPIIYIKDSLNYDEIKSLHDICDCYFHLTRTEGFCLGAFDAYNNNKKVIITGYGGHTEYLGKDYDGLIDYKLKPLSVNESVFFQFRLDDTYKWAIADKDHCISLLNKLLKIDYKDKINFGEGLHSLEISENIYFKWMSERNEIYINEDIDFITLDIINLVQSNVFQVVNNKGIIFSFNLNEGQQNIKIPVKNTNKIVIESGFFIPSKTTNFSTDNRKLSCKLYAIKVLSDNKEFNIPVNRINYINENIRKINAGGKSVTEYVGDYGEMTVRIKDSNLSGKINLGVQTSFYSHRSGWDYVVHNMSEFNNPLGVYFDGFIENAFSWRKNQYIKDKIIVLNLDNNSNAADIGNLSGIAIAGITGNGYIKTNLNADRFLIKTPLGSTDQFIATFDLSNNFVVSGNTVLINDVSLLSNLNVSSTANINNLVVLSNLNSLGINTIGKSTFISNIYVSGASLFNSNLTINSNLNVSNNTYLNNANITSLTVFSNSTFISNLYINNDLNVNNNSLFNHNISVNSNLFSFFGKYLETSI